MVNIFEYASETVDVSTLFDGWLEPADGSSQAVGFLDVFVLARSSFANSRAYNKMEWWHKINKGDQIFFHLD